MTNVSFFGEGSAGKEVLGGKGHGLDRLVKLGRRVPEGFTITTEAYRDWKKNGGITDSLESEVKASLRRLEEQTGRVFGSSKKPLLVSVRSGAPISMPGMMDTVLNVGATDEAIKALAKEYGDEKFAYETYRSFMRSFMGIVREDELDESRFRNFAKRIPESAFISYMKSEENLLLNINEIIILNETGTKVTANKYISPQTEMNYTWKDLLRANFYAGQIFTGAKIREKRPDGMMQGFVTQLTEEYLQVMWSDKKEERIPVGNLGKDRRIDFSPEARRVVGEYLKEAKSIGQFGPDTLRARQRLNIPEDPDQQILECIEAVFGSWENPRAKEYRKMNNIPNDLGTAVNIQRMVFGNYGDRSGTAVVFTSSPKSGKAGLNGEYIQGAQGEDLVAGEATPRNIRVLKDEDPDLYSEIEKTAEELESICGGIQDIELTWENGTLYTLQTRDAQLSPRGRLGFLMRQYEDEKIDAEDLVRSASMADVQAVANALIINTPEDIEPLGTGLSIVEGVAQGKIAFDIPAVESSGGKTIYCRNKTTPHDIRGMRLASGLLTTTGGAMSHAAIVAIGMNKVAIVGCESAQIHEGYLRFGDEVVEEGEVITLDGYTGNVYRGELPTKPGRQTDAIKGIKTAAESVIEGLVRIYEVQNRESDLPRLEGIENPQVLYCIDYDCLLATGAIDVPLSIEETVGRFKKTAGEAYGQLTNERTLAGVVTHGRFDSLLIENGFDPDHVRNAYIGMLASAAGDAGEKLPVAIPHSQAGTLANVSAIELYRNGKNCAMIKPWAVAESTILAAKEAIGNES